MVSQRAPRTSGTGGVVSVAAVQGAGWEGETHGGVSSPHAAAGGSSSRHLLGRPLGRGHFLPLSRTERYALLRDVGGAGMARPLAPQVLFPPVLPDPWCLLTAPRISNLRRSGIISSLAHSFTQDVPTECALDARRWAVFWACKAKRDMG